MRAEGKNWEQRGKNWEQSAKTGSKGEELGAKLSKGCVMLWGWSPAHHHHQLQEGAETPSSPCRALLHPHPGAA